MAYYSVYKDGQINTMKICKILKVEINLPVLKVMFFCQFIWDLKKLGSKIKVTVFSVEIKTKFDN